MRLNASSVNSTQYDHTYHTTNITLAHASGNGYSNISNPPFSPHNMRTAPEKHPAYVAGEFLYRWIAPMVNRVSEAVSWKQTEAQTARAPRASSTESTLSTVTHSKVGDSSRPRYDSTCSLALARHDNGAVEF